MPDFKKKSIYDLNTPFGGSFKHHKSYMLGVRPARELYSTFPNSVGYAGGQK